MGQDLNLSSDDPDILVVDDNQNIRSFMTTILKALGYCNIQTAVDGSDAFVKLQENLPDLLITDLEMKPVNGYDLVKRIRHKDSPVDSTIPIIVLTGFGNADAIKKALKVGANQFLVKPVDPERLKQGILKILSQKPSYELVGDRYVAKQTSNNKAPASVPASEPPKKPEQEVWALD